jgi:hypothetical protein
MFKFVLRNGLISDVLNEQVGGTFMAPPLLWSCLRHESLYTVVLLVKLTFSLDPQTTAVNLSLSVEFKRPPPLHGC